MALALAVPAIQASAASTSDAAAGKKIISSDARLTPQERAQAPLVEAADQLQRLVTERGLTGFAGIGIRLGDRSLVLSWKGDVPAALTATLAQLRQHLSVVVAPVRYSLADLDREARRIARKHPRMVTEVGPLPDLAGLRVAVKSRAALPAARQTITSAIPLTMTVKPPARPAFWRWDDAPPFWGGAAIDHLDNAILRTYRYCTTAFAARKSGGQEAIITARHCGTNMDWRTPVSDRFVGHTEGGNAGLDANVLTGSDYSPVIYVGTWDSNVGRTVVGAGNPAQGSYVIPSGSWSGASVVRVTLVNQYINLDGQIVGPGFWTEEQSHVATVGQGDSGGPVAQAAATTTTVNARGMIDAIDNNTIGTCTGRTSSGRKCAWRAFHVNIGNIASGLGLTIQTG
jgi:streptogrisin D